MTGERPEDDDVVEPTYDTEAPDAEVADADDVLPDADQADELESESEFVEDVAPEPEQVVSQEKAVAVAAAEMSGRKTVDEKGRPVPDDELPYIDDRVSKIWVGLIAAIFIGILLWGLLGGKAGFFSPRPTPEPSPSAVPSLTATPRPSTTPRPTTSATPATSASPAPSGTPAAPSASPSAAPTLAPSPT